MAIKRVVENLKEEDSDAKKIDIQWVRDVAEILSNLEEQSITSPPDMQAIMVLCFNYFLHCLLVPLENFEVFRDFLTPRNSTLRKRTA